MFVAIVCYPGCYLINFEINLSSQSSRFSTGPKSQDKNLNILRKKKAFNPLMSGGNKMVTHMCDLFVTTRH